MKKIVAFITFTITNMFVSMCGSLITPFFPPIADSVGISQTVLGLIIAAAPFGGFLASLVIGQTLSSKNRHIFMLLGVLGEPISLSLFSLTSIYEKEDKDKIIIIASVGRFIGGIGTSLYLTPFFGYIPILYPKDVEKKVSISEAFTSIGALTGPVLGSILYSWGGFKLPFIVFSCFGIIAFPFVYFALKSVMPKREQAEIKRQLDEIAEDRKITFLNDSLLRQSVLGGEKKLTPLNLITHYPVVIIFFVITILNICLTYFQPILSIFYEKQYGLTADQVGLAMTIVTVTHTISCYFAGFVRERKREMACVSLFLLGFSYTLCGPDSDLIHISKHLWIALVAQGLLGTFFAPAYVPSLPVLNEFLVYYYPLQKVRSATYSSAILTSGMFAGQLSGPIIAGAMADIVGFERACSYLGMGLVLIGIFYIPIIFMKHTKTVNNSVKIREIDNNTKSINYG